MNTISMPLTINWKKNLFFVWISQFLAMMGFGCCMPFIPLLLRDNLHIGDIHIRGVCVSAYYMTGMVCLCIASIIWGILADRFGRKIMLLRASYAAALCYPLLAFAPNFTVLLLIRAISSFFSGTVNPAQTLLVTTTPEEKHGFVLGTLSTSTWSGNMVGYLGGGLIVHYFGYTTAFLCCGIFYLISGLAVQFFVTEHFVPPKPVKKEKKENIFRNLATPGILWLLLLFLLLGIARRIEQPFLAMLVEQINGISDAAFYTGIVSASAALGGVFSGVIIGYLCDRCSPQKLIIPVLIACVLTSLLQAYSVNIAMLIIARFLSYFTAGGLQPIFQIMLTKIITPETRGTYFGWTNSINQAGGILCSLLSGSIVYFSGVRGVFLAGPVIMFLMIPLMFPTARACRKEIKEIK